ncbi:MAG: hypothetical protein R3B49_11155 [Phycisphaerales bacterium]
MTSTSRTNRTRASVLALGAVLGLGLMAGGCATTRSTYHHSASPGVDLVGLDAGNQGGSSDVVFASPRVQQYYIAMSPETLAELRRRDTNLAIYDPTPVTAIEDQWPVKARPDLSRERTTRSTASSDRTFIYYELEPTEPRRDWR